MAETAKPADKYVWVQDPSGQRAYVKDSDKDAYLSWADSQWARRQVTRTDANGTPIGYTNPIYSYADFQDWQRRQAPDPINSLLQNLGAGDNAFGQTLNEIRNLLPQFSKEAAIADATGLINRQARLQNEKNQPVIQRSVDAAGTSGSSMSALLAQKFATETAESASAMGAEQAKAYGQITSALSGQLAQLAASGDPIAKLAVELESIRQSGRNATTAANSNILSSQIGASASTSNARTGAQTELERIRAQTGVANRELDIKELLARQQLQTPGSRYS